MDGYLRVRLVADPGPRDKPRDRGGLISLAMTTMGGIGISLVMAGIILTVGFIGFGPLLILIGFALALVGLSATPRSRFATVSIALALGLVAGYLLAPLSCSDVPVTGFAGPDAGSSCTTLLDWTSPGMPIAVAAGAFVCMAMLLWLRARKVAAEPAA